MFNRLINTRRSDAYDIRREAAKMAHLRPHPDHLHNGEEESYRRPNGRLSYIANYSKGLRHDYTGEVKPNAYRMMVQAMYSTDPLRFERTYMIGTLDGINLVNPQSGLAFDLEGPDAQAVTMPPAPRIDSAEVSGEMGELYWMALLRDVNFNDYNVGAPPALVTEAINSLNTEFTDFRGPKIDGLVTPETLFRGVTPGDLVGPYVSQFLLKPIPYGTLTIEQLNRVAKPGRDYLTSFSDWLDVQNGVDKRIENMIPDNNANSLHESTRRYLRNLRDLATYVHFDALYEAYLNACLILLSMPARVNPGNPYIDVPTSRSYNQRTQDGFGTFGPPHILSLVTEVATRALKAVWWQKWGVHRRLRPEEYGGRIHVHMQGVPAGPLPGQPAIAPGRYIDNINREILDSLSGGNHPVTNMPGQLSAHFPINGTYLLPQAFVEGSPAHPAYASGHATVAGACVTVLKAWFDESEVFDPSIIPATIPGIPNSVLPQMRENRQPKVVNPGANTLVNYIAPPGERPLTVGGELNKLASNISMARNGAGVHWRTDYIEGLRLGEEIAIRLLQEQKLTYNEDHYLSLTKFDGTSITI